MTIHLTIIAKTPVPGRVKTRLCPPCTPDQAAAIARAGIRDTIDALDAAGVVAARAGRSVCKALLLDGEVEQWMPSDYAVVAQRGDGLGERLRNGFTALGPGLIVGMDTPGAARGLGSAIDALAAGDDVIGLAVDGGYWVIGLAAPDGREFDGVPMSTSNTGLAQLGRLHGLGRRVRLMAMARDLDDIDDLRALAVEGGPARIVETARAVLAVASTR